jgi:hypothetical protein
MESFDIAKWKKNFLNENIQEKYQVVFHDYGGDDVPYTEKFFDSESDAEDFVIANEWDYDDWDWEGNYTRQTRYYNPQENDSAFGYHIEKVAV